VKTNPSAKTVPDARSAAGVLTTDLLIALALLGAVLIPASFGFLLEGRVVQNGYRDAVAMEILDGEMEILAAGGWSAFPPGERDYPVTAASATNLPPGRFVLNRAPQSIRLEWRPDRPRGGKLQAREVRLP
jgi:hypothetical protein